MVVILVVIAAMSQLTALELRLPFYTLLRDRHALFAGFLRGYLYARATRFNKFHLVTAA